MSRNKKTPKNKSQGKSKKHKSSLQNLIRRFFDKNSEGVFTHQQICSALDIKENALRKLTFNILQDYSKEGLLKSVSHGQYKLNNTGTYVVGYLDMTARGAGFVKIEENDTDVFIAPQNTNQSMSGDLVKVQVTKQGSGRWEGRIIEVVERERTQFVGTLEIHDKFAFLIPDNTRVGTDIYIPKEKLKGAKNKDRALVQITVWPKSADNPYGEVLEILSGSNPNDSEMISILCNQGIDYVFPQEVIAESENVGMDLDPKEIEKRRDMRSVTTFTIDPVDAKDFDDALSIQKLENGNWEIGVHIADVSHYVRPGTAMDAEALKRSNSVYLVDRVIPMLPEQLSNMACSLRPDEDKFTFSAVFEMNESGKVYNEWFGKTVTHSDKRYAYEDAQAIIEGGEGLFKDEILLFDKIAKILRGQRLKKGALSIESEEVRFKLDKNGYPESLVIKTSKDANKLIEEFMLLANRKVAEFMGKKKKGEAVVPFVYRVHDNPDPAKIELFRTFIKKFGYELEYNSSDQIALKMNELLEDIRYKNEFSLIQSMAIRSMSKATYEMENIGHYGLAFKHYTHFTSPIRRYADLVVHRILQEELTSKKHRYGNDLNEICKRISRMERKASEAERESTKYFQVLFIQDKVGEEFEGTVSGIADHGMYVKMDESRSEGMIQMANIPGDFFRFDADKFQISGKKTNKVYNMGDKVTVKITEVNLRKRQIDLELITD